MCLIVTGFLVFGNPSSKTHCVVTKIPRIDFVGIDVDATLSKFSGIPDAEVPFRVREMRWLRANAESYGYGKNGNSWILIPVP